MSSSAFVCMAGRFCAGGEGGRGRERKRNEKERGKVTYGTISLMSL